MKAIMYGAGNIGRGFIGALLSQSFYEVTFVDVAEAVVSHLQTQKQYPVRIVASGSHEDIMVTNVTAINGNDMDAVAQEIAQCDIMATAVGARILKFIIPNLVAGIRKRFATTDRPLNIIICENLMDANKVLESMIKAELTQEECALFDQRIGLVEASIGRMVPVQTEEMKDGEPMRVCVERYGYLPTDKDAFRGEIPEIKSMVPFSPFDFYIKRKLYLHNMGHATCAYLGNYVNLSYIYEAIDMGEIRILVQNAMLESATALSKQYGVPFESLLLHITDLLGRFTNEALLDTCQRVGGDPSRKLSPEDRMIGSSLLCLKNNITPAYIAVGAAAAVHRYISESEGMEQSTEQAKKVLADVSEIQPDSPLAAFILPMYQMILDKKPLCQIRAAADACKAHSLDSII